MTVGTSHPCATFVDHWETTAESVSKPRCERLDQTGARNFDHGQTPIEIGLVAVVGVGHIDLPARPSVVGAEHDQSGFVAVIADPAPSQRAQGLLVASVETDDEVAVYGLVQPGRREGSCPMVVVGIASLGQCLLGSQVHRFASVPVPGACARHLELG